MRSALNRYIRSKIKLFLADAYYSHEISGSDYGFLLDKLERWDGGRTDAR